MAEITGILGDISAIEIQLSPWGATSCGSGNDMAERTGIFFPDRGVLKVSIHCHGCKKVRKVLRSGASKRVDSAQHKVTVTGTADAAALVKKLNKSGKQAVDWHAGPAKAPEAAPAPPPAEAQPAGDGSKDGGGAVAPAAADKKPEEPVKEPKAAESSEKKPSSWKSKVNEGEEKSTKEKKKEEAQPADEAKKDGGKGAPADQKAKDDEPEPAAAMEIERTGR
ncbi:hypothetical protein ACP4OV_000093 [Aristida adscensionis]